MKVKIVNGILTFLLVVLILLVIFKPTEVLNVGNFKKRNILRKRKNE